MEFRQLPGTDIRVSQLGVGSWQLAGPLILDGKPDGFRDIGARKAVRIMRHARELGINLVDTAPIYGGGEGERRVGQAIKGQRDSWVVCTKFGTLPGPGGRRVNDASPQAIHPSIEASLRRLGSDHVDILLYHIPPKKNWIDEGRAVLEALKAEGKIRQYGISTNNIHSLQTLIDRDACGIVQFHCSLLSTQDKMRKMLTDNNLPGMARGSMAGGKLGGKYFSCPPRFSPEDNRSTWLSGTDFSKYATLAEVVPPGLTMAQTAVRYVLDLPGVHTLLMGSTSESQYTMAVQACKHPPIDENVLRQMHEIIRKL